MEIDGAFLHVYLVEVFRVRPSPVPLLLIMLSFAFYSDSSCCLIKANDIDRIAEGATVG